jgi:hypothetical protein
MVAQDLAVYPMKAIQIRVLSPTTMILNVVFRSLFLGLGLYRPGILNNIFVCGPGAKFLFANFLFT